MIHYHGSPITPLSAATSVYRSRHAMVSRARAEQLPLVAEVCQSFALDNGAFSMWRAGRGRVDLDDFAAFVEPYQLHPGYDFCLIPDVIDGTEAENDELIAQWQATGLNGGVPVWHLHESAERLARLVSQIQCRHFPRLALGSSGEYASIGTQKWWHRMAEVMRIVCNDDGLPLVKLHGLRMLAPTVFSHVPLASADSCNIALNAKLDSKWTGPYAPLSATARALVLADRIEGHVSAVRWSGRHGVQMNLDLLG